MSSKNTTNQQAPGIGFFGLLTILFIGLKLTHIIDWSWVWVLAPLWWFAALTGALFIVIMVGAFVPIIIRIIYTWFRDVFRSIKSKICR